MIRRLAATGATTVVLLTAGCTDRAEPPRPAPRPDVETPASPEAGSTVGPEARASAPPVTATWEQPSSPRELARRLTTAERLLDDPATTGDALDAAAFESQLLYRQLARTPGWEQRVRSAVPPRLRATLDDQVTARRALRSIHTSLSDAVPAWRIVPSEPAARLLRFYREGQTEFGVPWQVLAAVNLVETGFGKIRGVSTAGALGPMQFLPETWAAYGEGDVEDTHDAILGAARYLAANGGGTGNRADLEYALYRYNNHPGYVTGILRYASILHRDPRALRGLVRWQIVYLSEIGDLWLPVGYHRSEPLWARTYARRFPERHLGTATD